MALLTLGSVELDGFEIPAGVHYGGAQSLVVHKLIGGTRVIDAMGRDDAALCWAGIFSGPNATARARAVDDMRASGVAQYLSWDVFCYNVVIERLDLDYLSPWWISYRIACTVLADLAQSTQATSPSLADSIAADIAVAAAYVNVSSASAQISSVNAFVPGTGGLAASVASMTGLQASINQSMSVQEQALDSTDINEILSASGSLAQLSCASGYIGRALNNLIAGS